MVRIFFHQNFYNYSYCLENCITCLNTNLKFLNDKLQFSGKLLQMVVKACLFVLADYIVRSLFY